MTPLFWGLDHLSVAKMSEVGVNYSCEVITMFEIDKVKFGAFVAQLRKEQGMTQKELAQKLYISDKAVSKWETGVSQS